MNRSFPALRRVTICARFFCQERLRTFQLESLILAQNERWRQA